MFEIREKEQTQQFEIYNDGELVQKVCRTCQFPKLIEDFGQYTEGHYRPDCKDCHREKQRKYTREVKDKRRVYHQRDRARAYGTHSNYTEQDYKELKEFANGKCMISGKESDNLQIDHVQCLSKQGLGSIKGNMILVTPEVNQAKRTLSMFEFMNSESSQGLVDKEQLEKTMNYLAGALGETLGKDLKVEEYISFLKTMEELAKNEIWRC